MKLPTRKSALERIIDAAQESVQDAISHRNVSGHLKSALPDGARTAGLIAGGMAGLTAGSAGISALRRRQVESGTGR